MAEITLQRIADPTAWEGPWRELERRADASVFQGATWTFCRAAERFPAPVLLRAHVAGQLVGLALFNARALWPPLPALSLSLHESGLAALDAVFIEHNAPLIARGHEALLAPMLHAALHVRLPGGAAGRVLRLSGVGDAVLQAAQRLGVCRLRQSRAAPFVDLRQLGAEEFAASLGPSTRQQLRRSIRRYETRGALALRRAADLAEAQGFFDRLVALHQTRWQARGESGAFADPAVLRFHRTLIARGFPGGEVDLLGVNAGGQAVGYLYNLVGEGGRWAGNYQGGFAYEADPHLKPGLVCHALAIGLYRDEGRHVYDLLAGESRYKSSLARGQRTLHWLDVAAPLSLPGLAAQAEAGLRRARAAVHSLARRGWPPLTRQALIHMSAPDCMNDRRHGDGFVARAGRFPTG